MEALPRPFGRYRLLAYLEASAGVEVFRGALPGLKGYEKPVVIRTLARDRCRPPMIEAFLARAQVAANIDHPNAVPVYEVGRSPEGAPFVVERWIPGPSLRALATRVQHAGVRWPTWFALHICSEVLAVLAYAEDRGLSHGDLRPELIRIAYDGEIRLTGFGQSMPFDDTNALRKLLVDTVGWTSPPADLPLDLRRWLAGSLDESASSLRELMRNAVSVLRPRVTLPDVAEALAALELDARGRPSSTVQGVDQSAPTKLDEPVRAETALRGPQSSEDWRHEISVALLNGGAEVRAGPPARAARQEPQPVPAELRSVRGRVRAPSNGGVSSRGAGDFLSTSVVAPSERRRAGRGRSEAPTEPYQAVVMPDRLTPRVSVPRSPAMLADRTDPRYAPAIDPSPTMELHPGRRGDVRIWLQAPPTVVGPRRLSEGLRLIRALASSGPGLSISVDGHRYSDLERTAVRLGEPMPRPDPLDVRAKVQGVLADVTPIEVLGARARARASGRLTFARQESETVDSVTVVLEKGNLIAVEASAAPLAGWTVLLDDPDLPPGMAARAFSMVVGSRAEIGELGSPLVVTALGQARAEAAIRQFDGLLGWTWGRFAFVQGRSTSDRVTDVPVLPRLLQWLVAHEGAPVLLARLSPHLQRPFERADDFDAVLCRFRLSAPLLEFSTRLGNGWTPREALALAPSLKEEPSAIGLTYLLIQLSVLVPA